MSSYDIEWLLASLEPRPLLNPKTRTQTAANLKVAKVQADQISKNSSHVHAEHVRYVQSNKIKVFCLSRKCELNTNVK